MLVPMGGADMNPIPPEGVIPTVPFPVNGYLEVLLLIVVVSLFVMLGMMLWMARRSTERTRAYCPVARTPVDVVFEVGPTGTRTDVLRCWIFGRRPVTCAKTCLHPARAA
jgi:hypothetical protein